jgi:HK97 family phage portal protein
VREPPVAGPLTTSWAWLKQAAARLHFGGGRWGTPGYGYWSTPYSYRDTAQTAPGNAAVMACIRWVQRTMPEAPLVVYQRDPQGDQKPILAHPLTQLLESPNAYYSGVCLLQWTVSDLMLYGNAYWVKLRTGQQRATGGRLKELWWVPAATMEPKGHPTDNTVYIDHYELAVDGQTYAYRADEVIHFRDVGIDPRNIRKGLSPLQALLREIATDDEAAGFTAALLKNLGVPGVVIAPGPGVTADEEELAEVKAQFTQAFGGEHRGKALVLRGPANVSVLSFSPQQMESREMRRIPEERVSAIYGTPAVVVGLGAGLDRSTFSNFKEAREAAYEGLIIPMQRVLAADLQLQLIPDFGDPQQLRLGYDYTQVRVLQDDQNALMKRAVEGFAGGILSRAEARQLVGQEATAADEVYQQGGQVTWVPLDSPEARGEPTEPPPAAVPPADQGTAPPEERAPVAAGYVLTGAGALLPVYAPPDAKQAVYLGDLDLQAAAERWDAVADPLLRGLLAATWSTSPPTNGHG